MKTGEPEPRALCEALADDLDESFVRLVEQYQHRVFAFALNLLADRAAAEELAQDTFVAAYRALRGYSPERRRTLALRAWLFTIALNRVRNRARHRPTLALDDPRVARVDRTDARDEPPSKVTRHESVAELRAALARLPLRYRAPVVLRHIEGRGYAEIAALLSVPVGTVKANVHRGLARLRADLTVRTRYVA